MVTFVSDPALDPEHYVLAYRASNSLEAHLLKGMLAKAGIPVRLQGEALTGGIGELPIDAGHVALWVPSGFLANAQLLLTDYEQHSAQSPVAWHCENCGEENDASFELCWQCQSPKGD